MKADDYSDFVRRTDQYATKPPGERHAIALYGLVGEIGSLVSAVKKKILAEGGEEPGVIVADIDPSKVAEARGRVPSLSHDRRFTLS
jgi:predicted amidohydrolase